MWKQDYLHGMADTADLVVLGTLHCISIHFDVLRSLASSDHAADYAAGDIYTHRSVFWNRVARW